MEVMDWQVVFANAIGTITMFVVAVELIILHQKNYAPSISLFRLMI